jgi:transcriptional regulator of acetoin/glycerol metabolism
VDFQLISATHQHLPTRVAEGRFREDLFYRLAGIELMLPPLRERSDKRALIREMLASEGGEDARLSDEAEQVLMEHDWPGNVRQLRHVLRSAAALANGQPIARQHLRSLVASVPPRPAAPAAARPEAPAQAQGGAHDVPANLHLNPIQANERKVLVELLEQHRWNVSNVAKALDVSRNTLYRKLHKLHIEVSHPGGG